MRKRTQARELALQVLYEWDIRKEDDCKQLIEEFWERPFHKRLIYKEVKGFTEQLVKGTVENIKTIDDIISSYAKNWRIKRMAVIDRNILRMGCFELLFVEDIPIKVTINEAVELAKRFGDVKSKEFVNGILDKVSKEKVNK